MEQPSHRFLAAIVSVDLHGYCLLTEQDEIGTHRALMTCIRTCLEPIVHDRQGTIVKSTGDGALIRFPTAPSAVEAMIQFQERLATSESGSPPSRRLMFRVGIHLATTIQEGGDVYGHGVNLAVRLQECAEPGSIFLSKTVMNCLDSNTAAPLVRLGELVLKNIEERVEVYCWSGGAILPVRKGHRAAGLVAATMLASMVVPTAALNEIEPGLADFDGLVSTQLPNETKPSEKVKVPLTIAATMQPDGETTNHAVLPMVGEHWAVPYWSLLDSSHDYEVKTKMAAVERGLESRAEIAEDAYTQALALYKRHTPKAFTHAIVELEEALTLKPDHDSSHAMLAAIYWGGLQFRWQLGRGLTRMDMLNRANGHLGQADPFDPLVLMVRSEILTASGRHDQAMDLAKDAIARCGSSAVCQYANGQAKLFAGRAREAEASIRVAIRLDPDASRYLFGLALAQFNMNRFDVAERTLARAIARNDEDDWLYLLMAATQGHLGLKAEARQAIGQFDRLSLLRRGWFASQIPYVHRWPFRDSRDQDRLHLGMVLAGIPEVGQ